MSNVEVLIKLRDLHEQLASMNDDMRSNEKVDEQTIDALGQLVTDIGDLVDRAKSSLTSDEDFSYGVQLQERIGQFESNHPGVSRFLWQLTEVLNMIGI